VEAADCCFFLLLSYRRNTAPFEGWNKGDGGAIMFIYKDEVGF